MQVHDFLRPDSRFVPTPARFVATSRFRRKSYGQNHPLAIPRVSLTFDLINAYGALMPTEYQPAEPPSIEALAKFHTHDYLHAYRAAQERGSVTGEDRHHYRLGVMENPYFDGFYDIPALATGASIQAAERVAAGSGPAFAPAGGMHHAAPGQARGFCYFNDPALAILSLRAHGLRVLYWDMDAHHGDGVEHGFLHDDGVMTASIHMDTGYAYPFTGGGIEDCEGGALNLPLPPEINDNEYRLCFNTLWPQVITAFQPDAVVLQAGTDILASDPLSKFRVSNLMFWEVVVRILQDSPKLLVLGGGGYHPIALARCWTGVWSALTGRALPDVLPEQGREALLAVEWDLDDEEDSRRARMFEHLSDWPEEGGVREEVRTRLETLLATHPLLRRRHV